MPKFKTFMTKDNKTAIDSYCHVFTYYEKVNLKEISEDLSWKESDASRKSSMVSKKLYGNRLTQMMLEEKEVSGATFLEANTFSDLNKKIF